MIRSVCYRWLLATAAINRTSPARSLHAGPSFSAKKASRPSISLSDLPSGKIDADGNLVGSLEPWRDGKLTRSKRAKKTGSVPDSIDLTENDPELEAALEEGSIPDSPLARQVFANWKRYPESIVLTRVGKFYESYFAPAIHLSSLLSLKLAYKRYKTGNFPFSGFPIAQLDKYLKILVHDLGHTVVLVEEYHDESHSSSLDDNKKDDEMIVRRVGRVVTPGTLLDETWLSGDESRYLLAVAIPPAGSDSAITNPTADLGAPSRHDSTRISLAYADVSIGEFFSKDTTLAQMEDELARIAPREVVLDHSLKDRSTGIDDPRSELLTLLRVLGIHVSFTDPTVTPSSALASLRDQDSESVHQTSPASRPKDLEGQAILLLRHHLQYALRESMPSLPSQPNRQSSSAHMQIDAATLHALEVRHALRPGGFGVPGSESANLGFGPGSSPLSSRGTLLSVLSRPMTPSGHRLLVRTLTAPSTDIGVINSRLGLVQSFVDRNDLRVDLRQIIRDVSDVMRIVQRFKGQRGEQRQVWDVARWIRSVERILERIRVEVVMEGGSETDRLKELLAAFKPLSGLAEIIEAAIDEARVVAASSAEDGEDDPEGIEAAGDAIVANPGRRNGETRKEEKARTKQEKEDARWWIRSSYSPELLKAHDEMDRLKEEEKAMELELQNRFNSASLTLVKGTRYGFHVAVGKKTEFARVDKSRKFESITEGRTSKTFAYNPWSVLGAKIEQAEETAYQAQLKAFRELRQMVVNRSDDIQHNAEMVDELDLSLSFAQTAMDLDYVRPSLNDSTDLTIINGRHPSVESSLLSSARTFTPNSTTMTPSSKLHIITGPNQGGKSTLLRQTAVIAILAQSGSFVPADKAVIGIVDKVFSRIGARDDLFRDRSTFMLEMVETAAILRQATSRSLVIMDEIGRGTTLNAGVSIAFATLDHILRHIDCRTLFATHYHELGGMLTDQSGLPRGKVSFFCTDVDETDGAFSYSYRLKPGINHNSHAIKAARLAGMPESFLQQAQETLDKLDSRKHSLESSSSSSSSS